jgi:hypothetical protein
MATYSSFIIKHGGPTWLYSKNMHGAVVVGMLDFRATPKACYKILSKTY